MKRSILIVAAIALAMTFFAGHVLAQAVADPINYGAQVGLNMAKLTGSDVPTGVKTRLGLAAGGFFTYAINDMFAVQVEAMVSMKGAKRDYDETILGTVYHVKQTLKLGYFTIPVLAKVNFKTEGNIKPNVFAGPYLGMRLSAKEKDEAAGITVTKDVKDSFKSTDFGVTLGAGVGMKMTKGMPFLNVRYDLGLSKIGKAPSGETAAKIKNGNIGIMIGYAFK